MTGKKFSHYFIQEKLGEGGMGVVYKAEDTSLDRIVALKFLSPHALFTDENKTRFAREAKAAASLLHPNVATIFEYGEAADPDTNQTVSFIAMEYVEGDTLTIKIDENPTPVDESLEIAISIAEALAKAHEKEITHRDIKSDNIMVSSDGTVKVMDFGLADIKGNTKVTKEGTTVGTIAYMSPEQAQGENYDHRSDIWSFGIVLYEILAGTRPFKAAYEQALIYQILNEDHQPLKDIISDFPTGLDKVVQRLLQKNPDDRYQTMIEVITDLTKIQNKEEKGELESSVEIHTETRKLTNRLKPIFIGTAALILIVIAAWFFMPASSNAEITSLAVLPFENITGDADQEYFADGMTDQLINELCKIRSLRIASRTSAMQFKGKHQSLKDIAKTLNVDGIITATVFRSGERLRLNASLTRVSDDMNLWNDSYERKIEDVLDLTSSLAQSIANQVSVTLTEDEEENLAAGRTVDPEAFDLVARGNFLISSSYEEHNLEKALGLMVKAVEIDPDYVQAYGGVAWALTHLLSFNYRTSDDIYDQAKTAIDKALELDPDYGLPYTLLGRILMSRNDMEGAMDAHKKAVELSPNDGMVRSLYSWMLMAVGRNEAGVREAEIAVELDPLSMFARCNLSGWYYGNHQYADARAEANRILELNTYWLPAIDMLRRVAAREGRFNDAVTEARRQWLLVDSLIVPEDMNYQDFLKWEAETMENLLGKGKIKASDLALNYAEQGDKDNALKWLKKAEERDETIPLILFYPDFDSLRDDPRFEKFIANKHLPVNAYCDMPAGTF